VTENSVPLCVSALGDAAPTLGSGANRPAPKKPRRSAPGWSLIGVALQDESEIDPVRPSLRAIAFENVMTPKSVSDS
jgi:hypothetical protein